jgi:signal transduction histidine kinase
LLDNLISNAIKFTPDGGRVDVRVDPNRRRGHRGERHGSRSLSSRGGARVRPLRSSRSRAQQVPGTGLGLFISRASAETHGGVITVSSQESAGTTFRIELPSKAAPQPESADVELVA